MSPPRFTKLARPTNEAWHNGADVEIYQYAKSLRSTARKLVNHLASQPPPHSDWDYCPVIHLYRQSLELHLKAVIGEGRGFLKTPTDHISLYTSHSLRWLAQNVRLIIKTVGWQHQFTCDGIANLVEFTTRVGQIESLDPVPHLVLYRNRSSASKYFDAIRDQRFLDQVDALLELLDATADALAAAWALQRDPLDPPDLWADIDPTIH